MFSRLSNLSTSIIQSRWLFKRQIFSVYIVKEKFLWFKQNFFESNKFVHCYIVKEKFLWFKQNFFESNKFVHCYIVKEKFLWFKQNFFESKKFVHCYKVKEKFLWFKEISWLFFFFELLCAQSHSTYQCSVSSSIKSNSLHSRYSTKKSNSLPLQWLSSKNFKRYFSYPPHPT